MISSQQIKGIVSASISSAMYGLNPLFALPLYKRGMDVKSVLTYRYLAGIVLLAIILIVTKTSFRLSRRNLLPQIACGGMMAFSSLSLYTSYNHMDVGIASTLLFIYPVMVAVTMAVFFHERINLLTAICMAMAMAGVCVLNWSGSNQVSIKGIMMVMVSALTWAFYLVIVRKTVLHACNALVITFYSLIFGVPVFLSQLHWGRDLPLPDGPFAWTLIFLMAFLPTVVSMATSAIAVQCVGPTITSIFGALEPLTAVLIGIFVFSEAMTLNLAIGFVLITVAVSIMVWHSR